MQTVSVVIPVYRSERTLPELYRQVADAMAAITPMFEIILVEDAGGDSSWRIIVALAKADPRVRGIRMSRNYGQHNAVLCGIRAALHEVIITMDDDLQHPASEIAPMLDALSPEFDVIYGAPEIEQHGFLRDMASQFTKLALASAMGAESARNVSAFRVFRTYLRDGFRDYRSPFVSVDVLLAWTTSRFSVVRVRHAPRVSGESGYTLRKLIRHAATVMTGFSVLPLQIASGVGFAFVLFGIITLAFVVLNYLIRGGSVPGFTFLASMFAIFSGAQLFALGIFGEYLARIHFRSMDRPPYFVGEVTASLESATHAETRPGLVDGVA
jgi:undecaprenyl-phosphate 4-deoxy-4-formamido-L-arabinose transferase